MRHPLRRARRGTGTGRSLRARFVRRAAIAALLVPFAGPALAQGDLPREGESLGGNWRAAPSVDGTRLGGLPEGTRLTILRNAGTSFNGYDWFEVEVNGRRGFQWGGILCSNGSRVPGLLETCAGTARAAAAAPANQAAGDGTDGAAGDGTDGAAGTADAPAAVVRATAALDGDWTPISADIDGLKPGTCAPDSGTVLSIANGRLDFRVARCVLDAAEPEAGGLRLSGSCDGGDGERWRFDRLAFVSDGGGLLALVDRAAENGADLFVYRGCWLPE